MNEYAERKTKMHAALAGASAAWEKKYGEKPRGACLVEKVETRTPHDELVDAEDRAGVREPGLLPLFDGVSEKATVFDEMNDFEAAYLREGPDAAKIMLEVIFWLLGFFFADGPHPGAVMRRLYVFVKKFAPHLIWNMGYRRLGDLFGETGANMEWRMSQLDSYLEAKGVKNVKMPWQKTEEACETYAGVQTGNANRVGGESSGKHKAANYE